MKREYQHGLLILLLCLLVYLNSFHTSLHYDDHFAIAGNAAVRDISDPAALFTVAPGRFLLFYSFAVNYHVHGLNPVGYHVGNFIFHCINALLVFVLVRRIMGSEQENTEDSTGSSPTSVPLLAGLIFAVHPIMTESVTYISGRASSMAATFYLLSLVIYASGFVVREGQQRHRFSPILYLGALVAFFLSMWVKESNATLPAILLLLDFYFTERSEWGKATKSVLRSIPFFLVLAVILLWRKLYIGAIGEIRPIRDIGVNLLTQMKVIVFYLRLVFFPVGQNIDHDFPLSHSLLEPLTLTAFLFLLALGLFGLWLYKRNRLASFGILWYFITLAPTSSVIPQWDLLAERWLYLPAVGLFMVVGAILKMFENRRPEGRRLGFTGTFCIMVILLLSALTIQRNGVWENEYTLWNDAVKKSPEKARPHTNLGMALASMGDIDGALIELQKARSLDPESPEASLSLSYLYLQKGAFRDAIALTNATLARFPDDSEVPVRLADDIAKARFNLGVAYFRVGDYRRALSEYQAATRLAPFLPWVHSNMGVVYEQMGDYENAIEEYTKELELNPEAVQVRGNIENARRRLEQKNQGSPSGMRIQ